MNKIKAISILFGFLILFPLSNCLTADERDPLVGQKAPLITGKNATGKGLLRLNSLMSEVAYERDEDGKLKEVDGKYVLQVTKNVVVLNFFSTTCIPCMREIPTFNRLAKAYRGQPVKMIYVNIDPDVRIYKIRRFIARKRIRVPMMLPNQKEAIRKYKALSLPRLVIIDRSGRIGDVITGFHSDLAEKLTEKIDRMIAEGG